MDPVYFDFRKTVIRFLIKQICCSDMYVNINFTILKSLKIWKIFIPFADKTMKVVNQRVNMIYSF